jgi:hypothetical protein
VTPANPLKVAPSLALRSIHRLQLPERGSNSDALWRTGLRDQIHTK